jgi:hypothetical protein
MKSSDTRALDALTEQIFSALHDTGDAAAIELFFSLLRYTPGLRQWLRIAHHDLEILSRFDAYLTGKTQPPQHRTGHRLLAWIASEDQALLDDTDKIEHAASAHVRRYGGLTRTQVLRHIRYYQSGTIALAPFLTTVAWRRVQEGSSVSPALLSAGGLFLRASLTEDRPQLVRHLAKAAEFFHEKPVGTVTREWFGFPNWWKLVLFHYILNHPKPRYRVREFQKHLMSQRLVIEPKDLRRFCIKHAITRDQTPGRPHK